MLETFAGDSCWSSHDDDITHSEVRVLQLVSLNYLMVICISVLVSNGSRSLEIPQDVDGVCT